MENLLKKKYQIACRRLYFNSSPSKFILKYIGCSAEEYRAYINSKRFEDMKLENYGKDWELDHIVPIELFDLTKEEDLKLCFNYRNMIPMYKMDNKAKGMSIHFSEQIISNLDQSDISNSLFKRCIEEKEKRYSKYLALFQKI